MSNLRIKWEHFDGLVSFDKFLTNKTIAVNFPKKRNEENYSCYIIHPQKEDGSHRLQLSYFIGVDWISKEHSEAIYVVPKLNTKFKDDGTPDNNDNEEILQTDYFKMLFSALKHPNIAHYTDELFSIKFNDTYIEINQEQDLLTPLLVLQFLSVLKEIVRKGLKKSYYKVNQNLNSKVKGKIIVGQTIKRNLLKSKSAQTFCSFDEFGLNSVENRLLKKALLFVQRYLPTFITDNSNQKAGIKTFMYDILNYINPAFQSVSSEVELNDVKHSQTNPFFKEYKEGIRLAKIILQRFGYNINNVQFNSKIKTPPFWIDMSKLFELYVLGLLYENNFGSNIIFQFSANYGSPDFLLKEPKMVIDTKYKTYYSQPFTNQIQWQRDSMANDIRQVSGYARDKKILEKLNVSSHDAIDCLIIYPKMGTIHSNENNLTISSNLFEVPIPEFNRFYKLSVSIPFLQKK